MCCLPRMLYDLSPEPLKVPFRFCKKLQCIQRIGHGGPCCHQFVAYLVEWRAQAGAFQMAKYSHGVLLLFQGNAAVPGPSLAGFME